MPQSLIIGYNKRESGFTLIEIAMTLIILGLLVGATFAFYNPIMEGKRIQVTRDRELKIARALSSYVLLYGVLPCPALPDASPLGVPLIVTAGAGGPCSVNPDLTQTAGIVPFRVLGLTQEDILDGYYNPFTYVASFAAVTSNNAASSQNWIDLNRTTVPPWMDTADTRFNQTKQVFCGQEMVLNNAGIRIYDDENLAREVASTENNTNPGSGIFGNTNFPAASGAPGAITSNLDYIAYILISHGKNGAGSYILGKPKATKIPAITANTAEYKNTLRDGGGNYQFVDAPYNTNPGAKYFDDIVLWRTQRGVMRELGNNSCATP